MKKRKKSKYSSKINVAKFRSTKSNEQLLSHTDRITYVYTVDIKTKQTIEVINVSYEIKIDEKWITIIRYDSSHGYLHKHIRVSLENEQEITTRDRVVQKGDHKSWLTWAIDDIQKDFYEYRRLFFKRSKIIDKYY